MFTSRPFITVHSGGAAVAARDRLLHDKAMRRSYGETSERGTTPRHAVTVTYVAPADEPDLTYLAPDAEQLSPLEQQQRALQVARSFKDTYLAEVSYLAERQLAIATIRPVLAQRNALDTPHRICVDAEGNINVFRLSGPTAADQHLMLSRVLLILGGLLSVLGVLSALTLF